MKPSESVQLLTLEDIAVMRQELQLMSCGKHLATFEYERIVATLEALADLASQRLNDLLALQTAVQAKEERQKVLMQLWRAECDRR